MLQQKEQGRNCINICFFYYKVFIINIYAYYKMLKTKKRHKKFIISTLPAFQGRILNPRQKL